MASSMLARGCVAAWLIGFAGAAQAQAPAEFFKGKTVEIYTGYSVGGGYDLYTRLLARHIGRHIPGNPTILPKNLEGAASLRLANWLYNVAPKDGTVFGMIGRGTAFEQLLGLGGAQFDGAKFNWIGSANDEVSVCVTWHNTGIASFADLLTQETIVGATGMADDTGQFSKVIAGVLGAKLKIVSGYPGGNNIVLAMERGELQGRCGWSWSSIKAAHPAWIAEKKINILVQLALAKHPDLPDVPLVIDLAKTDQQRQVLKLIFARQVMGRPFLAPPGVPPDRVAALRKAFMDTMADKDFLADAARAKMEITPVSGERIEALVNDIFAAPADVAKQAAALLK